jgi:predicted MPP superfamily phosphohydrolase
LQAIAHAHSAVKWIYSLLFWAGALSISAIFALRNSRISATMSAHFLFLFSSGWLVFTLYMVLCLAVVDCFHLFHHPIPYGFLISLGLTAGLLTYGYDRYRHPVVKTMHLTVHKPVTGSQPQPLKIVAVSDLHLGMGTSERQLHDYVRMIRAQQPDLILIGGDLVDNSIVPLRSRQMADVLSQLNARLGIYMVPGNHEYISGLESCEAYLRQSTPVHFLRDTVVRLSNGVQVVGRDDRSNAGRKKLSQLMGDTDPQFPIIVLDHQPYKLSQAVEAGADLLFCGHTHRGQVWPMTWLTDRLFDLSYGYEQRNGTHLYVSSGLALWGPPFRIGSVSEMVVFTLTFDPQP